MPNRGSLDNENEAYWGPNDDHGYQTDWGVDGVWGTQVNWSSHSLKDSIRSDESIGADLHRLFAEHPNIDASGIQVVVDRGEVTLSGTVSEDRQKQLAEEAAYSIGGVRDVHNQLCKL